MLKKYWQKKEENLKNLIKFIINDIKTDLIFIKQCWKGEIDLKRKIQKLKQFSLLDCIKHDWIWFFIILLCFCTGWLIASLYYQNLCNDLIINQYVTAFKVNYTLIK